MSLKCPACTNNMTSYSDDLSELVVDSCFYCGGIWFDRGELRTLFSSPKLRVKFLFPSATFRVKIKDAPESRTCPRCLDEVALKELCAEGVKVDECPTCEGIWLDSGEIIRLVEMQSEGKLKNLCQTTSQIKWGKFDQTTLGQVARMVMLALRKLVYI